MITSGMLVGSVLLIFFFKSCFVLSNYVSLRSMFRVVMSVTISAYKRCLVRFYLQLFVGGLMSYIRYLCLFVYSGVQMCCVVLRLVCHWCQFLWIVHF
jgi:hypothetical protein